ENPERQEILPEVLIFKGIADCLGDGRSFGRQLLSPYMEGCFRKPSSPLQVRPAFPPLNLLDGGLPSHGTVLGTRYGTGAEMRQIPISFSVLHQACMACFFQKAASRSYARKFLRHLRAVKAPFI